jgi:hypothetical protein
MHSFALFKVSQSLSNIYWHCGQLLGTELELSGEIKLRMSIMDFVASSRHTDGTTFFTFGSCRQAHN